MTGYARFLPWLKRSELSTHVFNVVRDVVPARIRVDPFSAKRFRYSQAQRKFVVSLGIHSSPWIAIAAHIGEALVTSNHFPEPLVHNASTTKD